MKGKMKKKVLRYFILSVAVIVLLFGAFSLLGFRDVTGWRFGVRNMLGGFVLLFLAQVFTGRDLTQPAWRPMMPLAFIGLWAYGAVISISAGGTARMEDLNGYILTFLGGWIFTAFLGMAGNQLRILKNPLIVCNFLLISWLSVGAVIFMSYFLFTGMRLTPPDMIAVLSTNFQESMEFLESHIGWMGFFSVLLLLIVYEIGLFYLVRAGFSESAVRFDKYRCAMYGGRALVLIGVILSAFHWIPRIYPVHDYRIASQYIRLMRGAERNHEENINALQVDASSYRVPGSVIIVIGESANRDHMKAFQPNHPTETTPWLSSQSVDSGFYIVPNSWSNHTVTVQALSMYLSGMNQYNGEKPEQTVTITDVANKAGYSSYWISNQAPSAGNLMEALSEEASVATYWTNPTGNPDENILPLLRKIPQEKNNFIVIHLEGSHDRHDARYPAGYELVRTEGHNERENAYDTSIRYNDDVLKKIYEYARANLNLQAMVYCSDHGEDMVGFHGAGTFTWAMARVPMWIYLSPEYIAQNPGADAALRANLNKPFTNDLIFDTVCGILKAPNNHYEAQYDLLSPDYSLTKEEAFTRHGKIRIAEDPDYR